MAYAAATGTIEWANSAGSTIEPSGRGVTVAAQVPAKKTSQISATASSSPAVCGAVPVGTLSLNQLVRVRPSYDVDPTSTTTTAAKPGSALIASRPSSGLRYTMVPSLRRP